MDGFLNEKVVRMARGKLLEWLFSSYLDGSVLFLRVKEFLDLGFGIGRRVWLLFLCLL